MTLEEQAQRQHGIVTAHIAAENAHDWTAAMWAEIGRAHV